LLGRVILVCPSWEAEFMLLVILFDQILLDSEVRN
jgi:hypothetical protein